MTSTSGRRSSLLPPATNGDLPNEPMVSASNTLISIIKHNRQRDQQTEAPEKRNDQINQQRHSLAQALDAINTWKKRNSIKDSTDISDPKNAHNTTPIKSQSINPPLDRNKSKSVTNYFYKRS
jgi:hypothetical protein